MLAEKEVFYASLVDEISKTAKYLHNQLAQSKIKPQEAAPPNPSFQVKAAQYTAFDLGQFAGISGPGPGAYIRPDYLPPFFIPPLLRERGRRKRAFAESSYSGGLGPYGRLKYESGIPPFQAPSLKVSGPPSEKKAAVNMPGGLTPAGRLQSARAVGMPKVTAPPGPSIAEISKPIGYGTPLPGATKTGATKTALIERLVRLGATDIPKTPRLLMRHRGPGELKALQEGVEHSWGENVTKPLMSVAEKHILGKIPEGKIRQFATQGAKLLAEDPVGAALTTVAPVPGIQPAYLGAKKGLEKVLDKTFPLPTT